MKLILKTVCLLSAAAAMLAGCKEEAGMAPSKIIADEQISISYRGGEDTIRYGIENPIDGQTISAVPDQEWLHTFDCGTTPGIITFQAEPNMNDGARSANVTLSYKGAPDVLVTVRQLTSAEAGEAIITVLTESPVSVPADGGDVEILYKIDNYVEGTPIEVTSDESWAENYDLPEYGKITVHAQINFSTQPRTAEVKLSYPNADSVSVILEQAATESKAAFTIIVDSITETRADIYWIPDDKNMTYVNGFAFKSNLDPYEGKESEFIEDEILNLRYTAEQAGKEFGQYLSEVLQHGDIGIRRSSLDPGTEYCAFAFGLNTLGEPLTGLTVERFQTKSVEQLDCTFSFECVDSSASSLSVRVSPDNPEVWYYTDIVAKSEYDGWGGDQEMMEYIAWDIETWIIIYQNNPSLGIVATWADYTEKGESLVEADGLFADTEYYAYAFGLDEGLVTTNLQKKLFRTPALEITDDCTFDISHEVSTSYMADVEIIPSNADTRYYVELVETSYASQYSVNDMATIMINNALNGEYLDRYTYSGTKKLNTLYDMEIAPLSPATDFILFVFGVENGQRTTEVAVHQLRTANLQPSSMTFDLSVTDLQEGSFTLKCTPSNNNEYYITGCLPVSQYDELGGDDAMMQAVIDYWIQSPFGIYSEVCSLGPVSETVTADIFQKKIQDHTEYYAFAFGYMGAVNTGATKLRFSTSGRIYSTADVEMECELVSGAELYMQDPYRYPYEDYYNFAVFNFKFTPNVDADGWYFVTINNSSLDYVKNMDEDELINILRTQGTYKPTTAERRENWYYSIVAVLLPVDKYGDYGELRIEEYYADPNAAGRLVPAATYQGPFMSSAGVTPAGQASAQEIPLRMWDGRNLMELLEGDAQRVAQPAMTREEAEAAMKSRLLERFPSGRALENMPFERTDCVEIEVK